MMNEQELADLFSEQVDRMLEGDMPNMAPESEELANLLNLGEHLSQAQFQVTPIAQAAFLSQIANWFGLSNGGSPMTIFGLSKAWLISIFVAVTVIVTGAGIIAIIVTRSVIVGPIASAPDTPTPTATDSPSDSDGRPTATPTLAGSLVITATPTLTSTPIVTDPVTVIFQNELTVVQLCQGIYSTQTTLVNYGSQPVSNADLVWEVIEGEDLLETIDLVPAGSNQDGAGNTGSTTLVSTNQTLASNFTGLGAIAAGQNTKIDIKVKVKDKWWKQSNGTEVKIKLKVKSKHGGTSNSNQIITVVRQGGEWVTLTGFAHPYDDGSLLIDGNIVVINNCTQLPTDLPSGSGVEVIGILQDDGTFIAVAIIIVDIDIIIVDFESGTGPEADGGGSGGGSKKGGSKKGGSKKGGS